MERANALQRALPRVPHLVLIPCITCRVREIRGAQCISCMILYIAGRVVHTVAEIISYSVISVAFIQVTPLGHFTHISITTSIVSALKKLLPVQKELSRSSNGFFKPILDPGGGFRSETAVT